MSLCLRVIPMRFTFEARDAVRFPPGKAANIFRGAFGLLLRRIACDPLCPGAASCGRAAACAYARLFEPRAGEAGGPSGFEDRPRPFVLRAAALDGRRFEPGERFTLDVNVFDPAAPAFECLRLAFAELWREGLGPGRARVDLVEVRSEPAVAVDLTARAEVDAIRVQFLTPTELKSGGEILREPRFDAVLARARDRVSSLCALYQGGAPEVDYRGMGERARAVRMTSARLRQVDLERISGRTGQRHRLGGFVGEAEYAGELGEFVPWLCAAEWTGVGRFTVWGQGWVRVEVQNGPRDN